jgi:hypothetical protein
MQPLQILLSRNQKWMAASSFESFFLLVVLQFWSSVFLKTEIINFIYRCILLDLSANPNKGNVFFEKHHQGRNLRLISSFSRQNLFYRISSWTCFWLHKPRTIYNILLYKKLLQFNRVSSNLNPFLWNCKTYSLFISCSSSICNSVEILLILLEQFQLTPINLSPFDLILVELIPYHLIELDVWFEFWLLLPERMSLRRNCQRQP